MRESHLDTDCFIVSQLISAARHVGRFKLRLKPTRLYVRLRIIPLRLHLTYFNNSKALCSSFCLFTFCLIRINS